MQEALENVQSLRHDEEPIPGTTIPPVTTDEEDFETDDERAPLTSDVGQGGSPEVQKAVEEYNKKLSAAISRISSNGIAIGYSAGELYPYV